MDTYRLNISNIEKITKTELLYREERGDIITIDLKMCRDRYLKYINSHVDNYPNRDGVPVEDIPDFNCVGNRYFTGFENAYFEFFDWPHIRFEIPMRRNIFAKLLDLIGLNWSLKYYKQFQDIQNQLLDAGWSTFDLS